MADVSTVQIANFALSKIGNAATIDSLTEESAEAKECNLWYDFARRKVLAGFSWSFARVRLALTAHNSDPPAEWAYRYQYPGDCIQCRFIENPAGKEADPVPFEVEQADNGTRSILTDQEDAILIYTKNESQTSKYSDWFVECFATHLAAMIAFSLTGKLRLASGLQEASMAMLNMASAYDATEGQDGPRRDAEWTRGRN